MCTTQKASSGAHDTALKNGGGLPPQMLLVHVLNGTEWRSVYTTPDLLSFALPPSVLQASSSRGGGQGGNSSEVFVQFWSDGTTNGSSVAQATGQWLLHFDDLDARVL